MDATADVRLILKIRRAREWGAAVAAGTYRGSAVDLRDGFIHFSTAAQVPETLRRHFSGQRDSSRSHFGALKMEPTEPV